MSTIYGSSVPATNGLAAPDQEGGLPISNPVMAPTAVVTSSAAEGAISQTIDSVAYNKEADQGNDTLLEPTTMAATDGIIGVVAEGVVVEPNARGEVGGGGVVTAGGFDVFTAGDELRY